MTSFEDKMEKLEANVVALESGDVPLDKALKIYTETMKLAKECDEELQKAREQITKIVDENGKVTDFEE